ncbi:MAG: hypothetical protein AB1Z19_08125 [Eubacteriales bacterium]
MSVKYSLKKIVWISIAVSALLCAAIYLVSLTLGRFTSTLLPDTGASWYYWKLPRASLMPTISVWVLYAAHQITAFVMIAKINKTPILAENEAGKLNVQFLIINAVFAALHILQTAFFYDGLAQQVPVMSSQGSVIVMLVFMLIMLNGKRGLFFGQRVKLPANGVRGVFTVHSYYIAWAIIYTFWFHPTEGTAGHIVGFFYLFLLMMQMSLAKTRLHNNINWLTLLETYVAVHGALVAVEAKNGMWPMFLFGFLMMFIVTGQYGIIKKKSALIGASVVYLVMAFLVFSGVFGNDNTLADIHQITWIPIILYGLVFVFAWVFALIFKKKTNQPKEKAL